MSRKSNTYSKKFIIIITIIIIIIIIILVLLFIVVIISIVVSCFISQPYSLEHLLLPYFTDSFSLEE